MKQFWKEHPILRIVLIALFFFAGVSLVYFGWTLTGQLLGLGIMLGGVALLIAAIAIYNKPFASF